jgi:hypothetical protein
MKTKAQIADYMVAFVPRVLFLIIVLVSVYFLVHSYIKTEVDSFEAESNLFVQRLLYSRNALAFVDKDTAEVQPGVIDVSKLSTIEDNLKKSISYSDSRHLAAKLRITSLKDEEISTFYFQKEWFDRWIVLSGLSGGGGSRQITRKLYVLLKDKSAVDIAILQNKIRALAYDSDPVSQDLARKMQDQITAIKSASPDQSSVAAYLEITVVMPNS